MEEEDDDDDLPQRTPRSQRDALNTFDQVGLAEVDDEATLQPSRLELREELGQEMIVRMLNRLELDNDFSKYEKVEFLALMTRSL